MASSGLLPAREIDGKLWVEWDDVRAEFGVPAPERTLRDYFAARAITGALNTEIPKTSEPTRHLTNLAGWAYALADAMLAEREKK